MIKEKEVNSGVILAWCSNGEGSDYGVLEITFPITFNRIAGISTNGAKNSTLFTSTEAATNRIASHSDYNGLTNSSVNVQKRVGHRIFVIGY